MDPFKGTPKPLNPRPQRAAISTGPPLQGPLERHKAPLLIQFGSLGLYKGPEKGSIRVL